MEVDSATLEEVEENVESQEIDKSSTSYKSKKYHTPKKTHGRLSVLGVAAIAAVTFVGASEIPQKPGYVSESTSINTPVQNGHKKLNIGEKVVVHPVSSGSESVPSHKTIQSEVIPQEGLFVRDVPYYSQIYTEDCETASLQMALAQIGINLSQQDLLTKENVQKQPPVMNGSTIVEWGDPYTSFVGNPNGDQLSYPPTGYGTYYSNIAKVAETVGANVLWAGTGLTQAEVYQYIKDNHPIIVWLDDNNSGILERSSLNYWTAFDGKKIGYPASGNEHNVLITGIRRSGNNIEVLINDPLKFIGPEWVSFNSLWNSMSTFNYMGVVLSGKS
ncbi:MAG: C39 family peptidase [Patescibacteria group bacterium]